MSTTKLRIIQNKIFTTICTITFIVALIFLLWIFIILIYKGLSAFNLNTLFNDSAPPMDPNGGIRHAIIGQLILVAGAIIIGVPIGILTGTYLSEYKKRTKTAELIKMCNDISMSIPSIIVGTFVFIIIVIPTGHFSGWAGIIALSIILIPIVVKTTEETLDTVPKRMREASYALGASKSRTIIVIIYKEAKVGLIAGILLAIARIAGETAPLLFTSFNDNFLNLNLNEPMPSLTVTMYNYTSSPYKNWQDQGWLAAFILTFFIVIINLITKINIKPRRKYNG